jgi:hypothetical protein
VERFGSEKNLQNIAFCSLSRLIDQVRNRIDTPQRLTHFETFYQHLLAVFDLPEQLTFKQIIDFYEPLDTFDFSVRLDTLFYDVYVYYLDIHQCIKDAKHTINQMFRDFILKGRPNPDIVDYIIQQWIKIGFKHDRIQEILTEMDDMIYRGTLTQDECIRKLDALNIQMGRHVPPRYILDFRTIHFETFYQEFRPIPTLSPNLDDSFSLVVIKRMQQQSIKEQEDEQYQLSRGEFILRPEILDQRYRKWSQYISDLGDLFNERYTHQLLVTKEQALQETLSRTLTNRIIQIFPAFEWREFECKTDDFSQEGEQNVKCPICDQWIEWDEPMAQSECCDECIHRNCLFQWLYLFYVKDEEHPGEKWPDCPGCADPMVLFWLKNDA